MKNLVYTVAFDPPASPGHREMGKLLVASLLRTYFTGDIVVFRNSAEPLFQLERPGLREVYVETPEMKGKAGNEMAWGYKIFGPELGGGGFF